MQLCWMCLPVALRKVTPSKPCMPIFSIFAVGIFVFVFGAFSGLLRVQTLQLLLSLSLRHSLLLNFSVLVTIVAQSTYILSCSWPLSLL